MKRNYWCEDLLHFSLLSFLLCASVMMTKPRQNGSACLSSVLMMAPFAQATELHATCCTRPNISSLLQLKRMGFKLFSSYE